MEVNNQLQTTFVTFVIPCFNEEENLPNLLNQLNQYADSEQDCNFILVNNGSTDESKKFLDLQICSERISVLHLEKNRGYGGGIWAGVELSKTQWTGWFHADLQISLSDIIKVKEELIEFMSPIKGFRKGRPLSDRILTAGMSIFCSILFLTKLRDINGQPTIYRTQFLNEIPTPPTDFSLDLHCYVAAKKSNESILRRKITMHDRVGGKSSWNTGIESRIRMIKRTLKYALALRKLRND